METYLDGTGYNTYGTGNQKWDTRFSGGGGILNFESWYPGWILRKNINFRPCTYLVSYGSIFVTKQTLV